MWPGHGARRQRAVQPGQVDFVDLHPFAVLWNPFAALESNAASLCIEQGKVAVPIDPENTEAHAFTWGRLGLDGDQLVGPAQLEQGAAVVEVPAGRATSMGQGNRAYDGEPQAAAALGAGARAFAALERLKDVRCKRFCDPRAFVRDTCLLYTSPSPRDRQKSRMPSSA